jgi:hypothetical protein
MSHMEDDIVVCCETPMLRIDDIDPYSRPYYYYRCLQCGACTDEEWRLPRVLTADPGAQG